MLVTKKDPVAALTAKATGGVMDYTCHPKSSEAKKVDPKFSNVIDCGLLLKIEREYLPAFITSNAFGFHLLNNKFFHIFKDIEELAGQYEFIKV